jgi:hypothetical protein
VDGEVKEVFMGFEAPFYTMVPNEVFDLLLPDLSGAELKVLLYVCRRTFGFGKLEDGISLSQMLEGVISRDGRRLDWGCGLKSRTSVIEAVQGLVDKHVILAVRQESQRFGFEATHYRLNLLDDVVAGTPSPEIGLAGPENGPRLVPKNGPPPSPKNGPTTKRSSTKRYNKKHHHPAEPAPGAPAGSVRHDDDDASRTDETDGVVSDALMDRMLALGLSPRLAAQKAAQHPPERIQKVLDWLPHRQAKNPVGYFLAELAAGDFAAPPSVERRGRQVDKAQRLQAQVTVQAAAEVAVGARIQAVVEQLAEAERDALMAEARRLVARRSGRTVERVPADSPWVVGMFETLVEERYCRQGG